MNFIIIIIIIIIIISLIVACCGTLCAHWRYVHASADGRNA